MTGGDSHLCTPGGTPQLKHLLEDAPPLLKLGNCFPKAFSFLMQWGLQLRQLWFKDALVKLMQEGLVSMAVGMSLAEGVSLAVGGERDWE